MSYSYIKRKLHTPEVVQIGKSNSASYDTFLNRTEQLENQVTLTNSYSTLILIAFLAVILLAIVFIVKKRNKVSKLNN